MLRFFACLQFVCISAILSSQDPCAALNYHAFKAESQAGVYNDLESLGIPITVSNPDDGISAPQEIGFVFEYLCQPFTQFILNTNGFIKLGAETNPKTNLFFSNAQSTTDGLFANADSNNVNLIAVFNHDIEVASGNPDFRVYTSGAAPDRICTIQWKNMREWSSDPATKQYVGMDFQLKLFETTNVIEFVYGDWVPSANPSNFKTAACGLKGKSADDDQLLVVVKNSATFWDNVVFKNGDYASNEAFNFGNPTDRPKPDVGRTYRFTPTNINDLSVRQVYALGDASSYYSSPQTISTVIQNSGFETQFDIPVVLEISGANSYQDTQYISQLAFMENTRVAFSGFTPEQNGVTALRISVGDDDSNADNLFTQMQRVSDFEVNHSLQEPATGEYGFLSGVQGIYYVKYPVHGTGSVSSVNAFIAIDTPSIGKTIFGAVLDANGTLVARSENYVIEESDLGGWHSFLFAEQPVLSNTSFYAGMGMTSSLTKFSPLGVQDEIPVRPGTYYTSLLTGSGLKAMDTLTFSNRFMIGATLAGTAPVTGIAMGDASLCVGGFAVLSLTGYTGFIHWQQSPNGVEAWEEVTDGFGGNTDSFVSAPLSTSTYYRAEIFQPGFAAVYSNVVFVEVKPENPVITASGDVLQSSVEEGNQWYDQHEIIPGATGQLFIASVTGTYYVIVTSDGCTSYPSNAIEILSVSTYETDTAFGIKFYPNPVKDELYIKVSEDIFADAYITIYNLQGAKLFHEKMQEHQRRLDMSSLPAGIYLIHVFSKDKEIATKKVVKR